ncbi:MAG TPA: hypothetical protein VGC54_13605 [Planctomycetota bacterium]
MLTAAILLLAASGVSLPPQQAAVLKAGDQNKLAKPVTDWIEARMAADTVEQLKAREKIEAAVVGAKRAAKGKDPLSLVGDWEVVFGEAREFPKSGFKKAKVESLEGFAVWVPKNYNPAKDPLPLVLLIPDDGVSPEVAIEEVPSPVRDQCLIVAPDLRGLAMDELKASPRSMLAGLGHATNTFRVDRNRMFMVGVGAGAGPAALYAALLPTFFSCLSRVGGEVPAGVPAGNLELRPHQVHGSVEEAITWALEQAPRNPYPSAFEYSFTLPWAGRVYWVQATKFDPEGSIPDGKLATMKVAVDRAANRITIDGDFVYQVTLYLNDVIVDLDMPVMIVRNGVEYEYRASRSVGTLLESYYMSGDASAVYPVVVRAIDFPAAPGK